MKKYSFKLFDTPQKKEKLTLDRIINKIKYDFFVKIFNNKLYKKNFAIYKTLILYSKKTRRTWGIALKNVSQRMKEEFEGLEQKQDEEGFKSIETSLENLGINMKDCQGSYKSFTDILDEVSIKWQKL